MEIHISVRSLVEFILRSGNIDNRRAAAADNTMQEGTRIHRMIQRRMGAEYQAEVGLKFSYDAGEYEIAVEGRADGIITTEEGVTVDEIKGTFRDLKKMKEAIPVHLAQAKCYAYIYGEQNGLKTVRVRMTYCHMERCSFRFLTGKDRRNWYPMFTGRCTTKGSCLSKPPREWERPYPRFSRL